jgi:hypothetical protein
MCAVCGYSTTTVFRAVDGFEFHECASCESLAVGEAVMQEIDRGNSVRAYDETYWRDESISAFERNWGSSLARVAETLLYARMDVHRFVDIGAGNGGLLDALSTFLPGSRDVFWGVESFPPPGCSSHENYRSGNLIDLEVSFQAGVCVEVVEHITPKMLSNLFRQLADRSDVGAIYMFNTALPKFVKHDDPGYLDPLGRGHIASYGLPAVTKIAAPFGFALSPIPGKDWAYILEYRPEWPTGGALVDRIWSARAHNKNILHDSVMGNLLYVLGIETARAYI